MSGCPAASVLPHYLVQALLSSSLLQRGWGSLWVTGCRLCSSTEGCLQHPRALPYSRRPLWLRPLLWAPFWSAAWPCLQAFVPGLQVTLPTALLPWQAGALAARSHHCHPEALWEPPGGLDLHFLSSGPLGPPAGLWPDSMSFLSFLFFP